MSTTHIAKQFFKLDVGSLVSDGVRSYRVTHLLSVDSLLAIDLATNNSHRLHIEQLKIVASDDQPQSQEPSSPRDLLAYSDEEWQEGQRRLKAIKPLLDNPLRTRQDAEAIAKANGVHVGTLYRWLSDYTDTGHVFALVPAKRGRKTGTAMLAPATEAIVQSVIEDFFLHKQRRTPQAAIEEVQRRCRVAKVEPPHPNTVRNRLNRIPDKIQLRRRGRREDATNRYAPIRGAFPHADQPFSVVQIDHTPADIIVVDETHRKPIGRPYITLAIDVHSRILAGLYLSFDPPSAASVGLCLAQAMCPKREYLAELGVSGHWPVWGRIARVHCDNAKEFRSAALERGCLENGIDLSWRPVKTPRYGGHIERYVGTAVREMHKLPGTTFSNTRERKGYDSESEASLTLKELERHLVDFFVNVYHQRVHSELGMSPLRKWELGITGDANTPGIGIMPMPENPLRLTLDFMPYEERTVQQYGIQLDNITYYDPVLDPYINALEDGDRNRKRKFIVRRDPRDISRIYFFDPADNRYTELPYRNIGYPAMSLYELKEVRRKLSEEGRRDIDEGLIFEALDRMRERIADAVQKSKSARRKAARSPKAIEKQEPREQSISDLGAPIRRQIAPPLLEATVEDDDPFALPIQPFEELALRR